MKFNYILFLLRFYFFSFSFLLSQLFANHFKIFRNVYLILIIIILKIIIKIIMKSNWRSWVDWKSRGTFNALSTHFSFFSLSLINRVQLLFNLKKFKGKVLPMYISCFFSNKNNNDNQLLFIFERKWETGRHSKTLVDPTKWKIIPRCYICFLSLSLILFFFLRRFRFSYISLLNFPKNLFIIFNFIFCYKNK